MPSYGLIAYFLLITSIFLPAFLLLLLYLSSNIFQLLHKFSIIFSKENKPLSFQKKDWAKFCRSYSIGIQTPRLRLVDNYENEAFWCLGIPFVILNRKRFEYLISGKLYEQFDALHEIGHLIHSKLSVFLASLSSFSFAGPGCLDLLQNPWDIEALPDRFALSRMNNRTKLSPEGERRLRHHLSGRTQGIRRATSANLTSKKMPIILVYLQDILRRWYGFYFRNFFLGYFHAPGDERVRQAFKFREKEMNPENPLSTALSVRLSYALGISICTALCISLIFLSYRLIGYPWMAAPSIAESQKVDKITMEPVSKPFITSINCMTNSGDQLYIGTSSGLYSYDKEKFEWKQANNQSTDEISLQKSIITSIYCKDKQMFVGATYRDGERFHVRAFMIRKSGELIHNEIVPPHKMKFLGGRILQILPVEKGGIVVNTTRGIISFRNGRRRWNVIGGTGWTTRRDDSVIWYDNGNLRIAFNRGNNKWKEQRVVHGADPLSYDLPDFTPPSIPYGNGFQFDQNGIVWLFPNSDDERSISALNAPLYLNLDGYTNPRKLEISSCPNKQCAWVLLESDSGLNIGIFDRGHVNDVELPESLIEDIREGCICITAISDIEVAVAFKNSALWLYKQPNWIKVLEGRKE